jgi:hypothetical protein
MTRKGKIIFGVAVGFAVISTIVLLLVAKRRKGGGGVKSLLLKSNKTLACSHICNIDAQGSSKAQNNLKNIVICLNNDIDIIEMDVQITRDNVPVLFHDSTLNGVTNGSGKIQDKTWSEVSQLRYNKDTNEGIALLSDAIQELKKSGKPIIYQLDKCDAGEIQKINSLGLFKGVESQMLCKGQSFIKPASVVQSNVMWMPIIPSSYVGKMNTESVIDEIVSKSQGSQFVEAQFSDADTLLIDGTLSDKLNKIGCKLLVVAVGGSSDTNGKSFRGDSSTQWAKMINPMKAGAIMTNHPLKLKNYINQAV